MQEQQSVILIHELKLAYFRVPKAANTSVKTKLAGQLEITSENYQPTQDLFWKTAGKRVSVVSPETYKNDFSGYFGFCFLRDPAERVLSFFNSNIKKWEIRGHLKALGFTGDMGFEDFVDKVVSIPDEEADVHFLSQEKMCCHAGFTLPQFFGKVEELERDWLRLRDILKPLCGMEIGILSNLNQTKRRTADVVESQMLKKIQERYEKDYELIRRTVGLPGTKKPPG